MKNQNDENYVIIRADNNNNPEDQIEMEYWELCCIFKR